MALQSAGWLCFYVAMIINIVVQVRIYNRRRKIESESERVKGQGPYSWPKPHVAVKVDTPQRDEIAIGVAALLLGVGGFLVFIA